VGHWRGDQSGGDDAGGMGDIGHQLGADGVGDAAEGGIVDSAGISARAGDDHHRFFLPGQGLDLVHIEKTVAADTVMDHVEETAGKIDRTAMGEMAAVGEVHAHHLVAEFDQTEKGGEIGLRAGVGLHIGVVGPEELTGAVAREILGLVDEFAAAVVALAGIALGVLVGQGGTHGLQHSRTDKIFRSDQLELVVLAVDLFLNCRIDGRILRLDNGHGLSSVAVGISVP